MTGLGTNMAARLRLILFACPWGRSRFIHNMNERYVFGIGSMTGSGQVATSASVQRHHPLRNMPAHIGDDAPRWRLEQLLGQLLKVRQRMVLRISAHRIAEDSSAHGLRNFSSPIAERVDSRAVHPTAARRPPDCPALPSARRAGKSRAAIKNASAWPASPHR